MGSIPGIIGHGSTSFVSTIDDKTVLKGSELCCISRLREKCSESSEDRLAREDTIYQHFGSHPLILKSFGLEKIRPGVHSPRLEMAPPGCIRLHTQSTPDSVVLPLQKVEDPPPLTGTSGFSELDVMKQERFALGVALFEIITWKWPFDELGQKSCEVDVKYAGRSSHPSTQITLL